MQGIFLTLLVTLTGVLLVLFSCVRRLSYALWLFGATFGLLSAIYVAYEAAWVGVVQFILYVGGLLILFSYGLMLTDRDPQGHWTSAVQYQKKTAGILLPLAIWMVLATPIQHPKLTPYAMPTLIQIGQNILTQYALFFELIGLLLLVLLIAVTAILKEAHTP